MVDADDCLHHCPCPRTQRLSDKSQTARRGCQVERCGSEDGALLADRSTEARPPRHGTTNPIARAAGAAWRCLLGESKRSTNLTALSRTRAAREPREIAWSSASPGSAAISRTRPTALKLLRPAGRAGSNPASGIGFRAFSASIGETDAGNPERSPGVQSDICGIPSPVSFWCSCSGQGRASRGPRGRARCRGCRQALVRPGGPYLRRRARGAT
jgi:hypothetical protein